MHSTGWRAIGIGLYPVRMAADMSRTVYDDRADAWEAHAKLERELQNLRAHLAAAPVWLVGVPPGAMRQAARSADIVAALAADVARFSRAAARTAEAEQAAGVTVAT